MQALGSLKVTLALCGAAIVAFFIPWPIAELRQIIPVMIAAVLLNFFVLRYEAILTWYRAKALPYALEHGLFVVFTCTVLVLNALTLAMGAGMTTVTLNVLS